MPKGWIHFSVEALHDDEEILFDFLEKEFSILEVDHSALETSNIVRLLLEAPGYEWFIPTIAAEVHNYFLEVERQEDDSLTFKVTLINEDETSTH